MSSKSRPSIYYGRNVLKEALAVKAPISTVFVENKSAYEFVQGAFGSRGLEKIEIEEGIPPSLRSESHQGVAFRTQHRFYYPFSSEELATLPALVICNRLEDVHNLGSIARCAGAFGFAGIIHEETNSAELTPAVMKASAGLAFRMKFVKVKELPQALFTLKSFGFHITGLDVNKSSQDLKTWKPSGKPALVLGSEGLGLEPAVKAECHDFVKIAMAPKVESLNVSHAAAIVMNHLYSLNVQKT